MEQSIQSPLPPQNAFRLLHPVLPDYATAPIHTGFNWSACASFLPAGQWYMVVFRSVRLDEGEHLTLEMYDYGAYIEAQRRAEGLLMYYRGYPDEQRACLSFCIWSDRAEAMRAAQLPLHTIAMSKVAEMYESYSLERYVLLKTTESSILEFRAV